MSDYVLRDLQGMDEFLAAEELQRVVWGKGDVPDPADLLMVIQSEGGLLGGAFQGNTLIGYLFGFPTREPHVQHSHRLAVHPNHRGQGLAVMLKQYQRDWCLARGIHLVRWTFDPQRHTNANLNITRLGVVVRTYLADFYGAMKGINAGVASDRLLAEWHLNDPVATLTSIEKRIHIGRDFEQLLTTNIPRAIQERLRIRAELQNSFSQGLMIMGYDSDRQDYLLAHNPKIAKS